MFATCRVSKINVTSNLLNRNICEDLEMCRFSTCIKKKIEKIKMEQENVGS